MTYPLECVLRALGSSDVLNIMPMFCFRRCWSIENLRPTPKFSINTWHKYKNAMLIFKIASVLKRESNSTCSRPSVKWSVNLKSPTVCWHRPSKTTPTNACLCFSLSLRCHSREGSRPHRCPAFSASNEPLSLQRSSSIVGSFIADQSINRHE